MAVTRLKRKHRKNIARANNKQRVIKQLLATPVIKNVDVEELKAQFKSNPENGAAKSKTEKVEKVAAPVKEAGKANVAPETAAESESSIFSTVKDAIAGAASTVVETVVDKVEDVVEAVKDRVDNVINRDEEDKEEKTAE